VKPDILITGNKALFDWWILWLWQGRIPYQGGALRSSWYERWERVYYSRDIYMEQSLLIVCVWSR